MQKHTLLLTKVSGINLMIKLDILVMFTQSYLIQNTKDGHKKMNSYAHHIVMNVTKEDNSPNLSKYTQTSV